MNNKVGLRIKPKFWLLVLLAAYLCVSIAIINDNNALAVQQMEISRLEQQKSDIKASNEQLRAQAEFAKTDAFIEREARTRGMIKPDETRYVLSAEVNADNAQGGN